MNDTSKTILAFVGGALAGAAVGILLAPDKGSSLRRKIKDRAQELSGDLTEAADEKYQEFKAWKNKIREKAEDGVEQAREKVDRVRRNAEERVDHVKRTVNSALKNENHDSETVRRTPPRNAEI